MAYARTAVLPHHAIPKVAPRAQRSIFLRLLDAIERANKARAEREIARYFATYGGKFTDEIERDIERRFLSR